MKNKKGFTLVEILGVITILSVLALIAIPTIDNIVTKNREKLYDSQIKTIEDGLKTWADANAMYLPEDGDDGLLLSLGILKLAGFVDEDIKNPNTNLCFSNDMMVSIAAVKEGYTYYIDEESGLDGTEEDCSVPTATDFIYLKGSSTINLSLDSSYEEPGYLALNSSGNIVTSQVTTLIRDKNSQIVSSIDTSEDTASPYTITYTIGEVSKTRTIIVKIGDPVGTIYTFDYTGTKQTITLGKGSYKLETWGAQGGKSTYSNTNIWLGGYGGYSKGELTFGVDTVFNIYVGGAGADKQTLSTILGGFNGGGNSGTSTSSYPNIGAAGGGASDIRMNGEELSNRIIVAGGGGGAGYGSNAGTVASPEINSGGPGGGSTGLSGIYYPGYQLRMGAPGTQSAGGAGGTGGSSTNGNPGILGQGGAGANGTAGGGGGGGGYYGGGGGANGSGCAGPGGGGSGYIGTLTNAQTIAGNGTMPTHDGTSTMTGNSGNGYVKITKIA